MTEAYRRGDIVLTVLSGDYEKPRPALVIRRIYLMIPTPAGLASQATGLRVDSEVMIDKMIAAKRERIRRRIGHAQRKQLAAVDRACVCGWSARRRGERHPAGGSRRPRSWPRARSNP